MNHFESRSHLYILYSVGITCLEKNAYKYTVRKFLSKIMQILFINFSNKDDVASKMTKKKMQWVKSVERQQNHVMQSYVSQTKGVKRHTE